LVKIKKLLISNLKKLENISFNSPTSKCSPSILNVSFLGIEGESLLLELDSYGIYCGTGSACASRDLKPSYVLLAMGVKEEIAHMSLRFSFGRFTKEKDIKYLIKVLPIAIKRIKGISLDKI
jgi:cysteine desulfurase